MTRQPHRAARRVGDGDALLRTVQAGVLLVLLTPLVVSPSTIFPYVVGKALFARSAIAVTFALWLILIARRPDLRPPRSAVLAAFGLWLLVSAIAGLAGVSPVRSLWSTWERMQGVADLAHWFAFALAACSAFRTPREWRLLLAANLGVCGLTAALGLGQHYGVLEWDVLGDSERVGSTLGNATYLGAYAMVSALLGAGLLARSFARAAPAPDAPAGASRAERRRRGRAAQRGTQPGAAVRHRAWLRAGLALAIALCVWTLWLTATRGALAGLAAGGGAVALHYAVRGAPGAARWAGRGALALAIAAAAVAVAGRASDAFDPIVRASPTLERLVRTGEEGYDVSAAWRAETIAAGLRAAADRPLLGWGPENFVAAWGSRIDAGADVRQWFDQAHNKPVEELATKGAAGLLAYLLLWLALGRAAARAARRREGGDPLLALTLGAALVAYFVQNLFLFDTPTTAMLFAVLAAFAASQERWSRGDGGEPAAAALARLPGARRIAEAWRGRPAAGPLAAAARTRAARLAAIGALAAAAAASLAFLGARPYAAAEAAARASDAARGWDERLAAFREAVDGFPGLANGPRITLAADAVAVAPFLSSGELAEAAGLIEAEGRAALDAEPRNWRVRVALARFYQQAAARDPAHLGTAAVHVREAVRLAPGAYRTIEVREEQDRLERLAAGPPPAQ